ncbi:glycosyltransferase family 2 protein [Rubritalea marina]|uniref:glycosyltransferase family 2 protein n=1 Tax=Rubritalea marina TaxID=361055 RepID=UPI00035E08DF|nr:glycosyltransferase family 2 protein [Rubritalea marina]
MKVAVIISTYNWPQALDLCLASLAKQVHKPDEVIIGDDGSAAETRSVIDSWCSELNIIHEWQEDTGFRLARSRNLTLRKVTAEYVICIDGDMVAHRDFVADHVAYAKKGSFVQGSRVLLNDRFSKQMMRDPKAWSWDQAAIEGGVLGNAKNLLRKPWATKLIGLQAKATAKNTRTCNMAFWRDDLYAVNGFDNRYEGWGREDSDLAWRLVNYGVKRRKLKFSAVALHIYHPEESREALPENDKLLERVLNDKTYYRCESGIEE